MESSNQNHTQVAQEKLAQVLNLLGANGAWWYALYETNKDETNMLDLLRVDSITLSRIYEVCGFTFAVKGAPKAKFNKIMFDSFKTNHDLDVEVERTVRSSYFRIGSFRSDTGVFSMQGQKKMGLLQPRIGTAMRRQIDKLIVDMVAFIGGEPDTATNQPPTVLFASPLARQKPPAVTPAAQPRPKEDPALRNFTTFLHDRLIVKLLVVGKNNEELQWQETLTVESAIETIDSLQRELKALKAAKLAKILNSKPLSVDNEGKYVVLREYGIPLNDNAIQAIIQDIHTLNNDLTDGSDLFSVHSNNDKNRKLLSGGAYESFPACQQSARARV